MISNMTHHILAGPSPAPHSSPSPSPIPALTTYKRALKHFNTLKESLLALTTALSIFNNLLSTLSRSLANMSTKRTEDETNPTHAYDGKKVLVAITVPSEDLSASIERLERATQKIQARLDALSAQQTTLKTRHSAVEKAI